MFAEESLRKARLSICKGCPYYFENNWLSKTVKFVSFGKIKTGTCGRPIIGQKIKAVNLKKPLKKFYKLCGCVMESKTAIESVNCPIGKW